MKTKEEILIEDLYNFLDTYGTVYPDTATEREAVKQRDLFKRMKEFLGQTRQEPDREAVEFGNFLNKSDYYPTYKDWVKRTGNLIFGEVIDRKTTKELYDVFIKSGCHCDYPMIAEGDNKNICTKCKLKVEC